MKKNILLKGITRNVLLLGLVSLFTDLSSQMVFPLIPLFMVSVLGTGTSAVGIVEGAAEMTASLLKIVSGYWSDKIRKRKPFIFLGYSLSSLVKPLFAFTSSWAGVLLIRTFERIGKGLRNAPRDAVVAESCDARYRGKAFGFQRTLDGVGSILGALLAYVLLHFFRLSYRNIFIIAFFPGLLAIASAAFVKERKDPKAAVSKEQLKFSLSDLSSPLRLFIAIATLFTLGHYGYAFLLLRAKNVGFESDRAILLYVLFYIVYTFFSIPAGVLSDRIGRKNILKSAYLVFAGMSFWVIFVTRMPALTAVFVLYGIFYAFVDGTQRALVVDMAPPRLKATALGTYHAFTGLAALPGGLIAGVLWDKVAPEATFICGAVLSAAAFFLFGFLKNAVNMEASRSERRVQ
ncbi:MAG: MFS transporter [Candidatus Aureabacteria bacterium]|nr:MFS transporter [Candidatus Auribacterota bacterium]